MQVSDGIFHAYDIRGTTDELGGDLARRVGAAVVAITGAKKVVVGRDMRATSPALAEAVIDGIRSRGVDVVDIGMCSTPVFNFAVAAFPEHEAGVMVTASHNPAQYNGFKILRGDAMPVSGEEIKPIVLGISPRHCEVGDRKNCHCEIGGRRLEARPTERHQSPPERPESSGRAGFGRVGGWKNCHCEEHSDEALGRSPTGEPGEAISPEKKCQRRGNREVKNIIPPYLKRVLELVAVPSLKGMKVVVDAGNGMGGATITSIFASLDCEMIPMYFEPDGRFPNHEANPIKLETLKDLHAKVAEVHADIGIALDGDADRVGFVDENGVFVNGDLLLAILAEERLRAHSGKGVVYSPNASWAVRDAIARGNGVSLLEKVGRTHIIRRMAEDGAVFGGEVSAHYFYPEFSNMESTEFTILLVLKLLKESGKKASDWLAPYRKYAQSGEINFSVKDKEAVLADLEKHYGASAVSVNKLDGLRVEFHDWWFNARKSNTEPLVRLNVEATSQEMMKEKRDEISLVIRRQE